MEVKQTQKALIVRALLYWWWLGWFTLGGIVIWDILSYKRNRLILSDKTVRIEQGVLSLNTRDIPYAKIQSVSVNQSVFGQMASYGHIVITSGNDLAPILFKYVDNPQAIRQAIQDKAN
jgi:uncharacterized membrane protein YdbT with pleckstrin-like domain